MIWPAAFLVNSFQMLPSVNLRAYASPYGGSEQLVDLLNDRWHCSLTVSPRRDVDGAALEGFVYGLRQGINTVDLWHMLRPAPVGTMRGTPLLSAAAQGAASLSITGAGAGATLKAGDMLGIGLLVMVQSDCTADGSGNITVPIVNRLRSAIAGGAAVVWNQPTAPFRMVGAPAVAYVPGVANALSLDFVEHVL